MLSAVALVAVLLLCHHRREGTLEGHRAGSRDLRATLQYLKT